MNVEICTKAKILNHNDKILISQPASKNINHNIEFLLQQQAVANGTVQCKAKSDIATTRSTEGAQTIFLCYMGLEIKDHGGRIRVTLPC